MSFPRFLLAAAIVVACSKTSNSNVGDSSTTTNSDGHPTTTHDSATSDVGDAVVDSSPSSDSATSATLDAAETAPDGDTMSDTTRQLISEFVDPFCTALAACCADAGISASSIGDCQQYELAKYEPALDNGSAILVPTAFAAALQPLQTNCAMPAQTLLDAVVTGTYTPGTACTTVDECAGDPIFCLTTGNATTGTCTTPRRGKAGDACLVTCDETIVPCRYGLTGDPVSAGACYDQDSLRCDFDSNTCVATLAHGAACSNVQGECGTRYYCDATSNQCQPNGILGAACGATPCDTNLTCYAGLCVVDSVSPASCTL